MVDTLINERQETMFNTELSTAADEMVEALKSLERAKRNKDAAEKNLIEVMKEFWVQSLSFDGGVIDRQYVAAKEKIKVKFV